MANQQPPKGAGGSKWGSFFTQAVAGVEAQLDSMLTEAGEGGPGTGRAPPKKEAETPQRQGTPANTTTTAPKPKTAPGGFICTRMDVVGRPS